MIRMRGSFVTEVCEATLGTAPPVVIDGATDVIFACVRFPPATPLPILLLFIHGPKLIRFVQNGYITNGTTTNPTHLWPTRISIPARTLSPSPKPSILSRRCSSQSHPHRASPASLNPRRSPYTSAIKAAASCHPT
jgi:26S proteasome regulatory subunit T1